LPAAQVLHGHDSIGKELFYPAEKENYRGKGKRDMPLRQVIKCPVCGAKIPIKGVSGRPPLNIPVKKVYDSIEATGSITAAAKDLGCSRGYIYKVIKENGKR